MWQLTGNIFIFACLCGLLGWLLLGVVGVLGVLSRLDYWFRYCVRIYWQFWFEHDCSYLIGFCQFIALIGYRRFLREFILTKCNLVTMV